MSCKRSCTGHAPTAAADADPEDVEWSKAHQQPFAAASEMTHRLRVASQEPTSTVEIGCGDDAPATLPAADVEMGSGEEEEDDFERFYENDENGNLACVTKLRNGQRLCTVSLGFPPSHPLTGDAEDAVSFLFARHRKLEEQASCFDTEDCMDYV
jgi:hypothetical protein